MKENSLVSLGGVNGVYSGSSGSNQDGSGSGTRVAQNTSSYGGLEGTENGEYSGVGEGKFCTT